MHAAFGTVLWIVCGVAAAIAIVALVMSGRTWSELGKGGLVMDRDQTRAPAPASERDEDIRAMLAARNARRARRGEAPLDVEAELERLTTPPGGDPELATPPGGDPELATPPGGDPELATPSGVDPELADEVRQLVQARNARRTRAGKPPLDVEAEVARELRRVSEGLG